MLPAMALYRAQILLEDSQHDALERLARDSGRSMSELVREATADYLARTSQEESVRRSLAAIDGLAELRQHIEEQHGCLPALFLDELREERDGDIALC
jgi:hypothetical protein